MNSAPQQTQWEAELGYSYTAFTSRWRQISTSLIIKEGKRIKDTEKENMPKGIGESLHLFWLISYGESQKFGHIYQ